MRISASLTWFRNGICLGSIMSQCPYWCFSAKLFSFTSGTLRVIWAFQRPFLIVLAFNYSLHNSVSVLCCDVVAEEPDDFGIVFQATFCLRDVKLKVSFRKSVAFLKISSASPLGLWPLARNHRHIGSISVSGIPGPFDPCSIFPAVRRCSAFFRSISSTPCVLWVVFLLDLLVQLACS